MQTLWNAVRLLVPGALALGLAACNGGTETPDAGDTGTPDAGEVTPPTPTVCDADQVKELELSATGGSIEFDTSEAIARPLDMGVDCGNPAGAKFPNQVVVKMTIPGTGPKSVVVSTKNSGTDSQFPTFVQVRRTCDALPAPQALPTCFGPSNSDVRATGRFAAEGGETVYVYVTGYAEVPAPYLEEGRVRLQVGVDGGSAPTLTSAQANWLGDALEVLGSVSDTNRNIYGLAAVALRADDTIVDLDGNGTGDDADAIVQPFSGNLSNLASYTGAFLLTGSRAYLEQEQATKLRVYAFDTTFFLSEPQTVAIGEFVVRHAGESCDETNRCSQGLSCTSGSCTAPASAVAACDAAAVVTFTGDPTQETVSTVVPGTVLSGAGAFTGSCAPTPGREVIYGLDLPEGTFDIQARTNVSGTATSVDTVVYLRGECVESTSELACNDEASGEQNRSNALAYGVTGGGRRYVFVEIYNGLSSGSAKYNVQFTVRPVLATGAACDKTEVKNRCGKAHCLIATETCP